MSYYAYFCNIRKKGVCNSWSECEAQITDKKTKTQKDGAKFAKFPSWRQAMAVVGAWEKKAKIEEKAKRAEKAKIAKEAKEAEKALAKEAEEGTSGSDLDEPEPPKRARSAYLLFTLDRRPHIVAENPGMKGPKIMKQMGAEWRELDKDEKVKYENSAKKDKERYEAEKERFVADGGDLTAGKKSKSK